MVEKYGNQQFHKVKMDMIDHVPLVVGGNVTVLLEYFEQDIEMLYLLS